MCSVSLCPEASVSRTSSRYGPLTAPQEIKDVRVGSGAIAQGVRTFSENSKCNLLHQVNFLLSVALVLAFFYYCYLNPRNQMLGSISPGTSKAVSKIYGQQSRKLSRMVYRQPQVLTPARKDVLVVTPWLAPIIWEGTFNTDILNEQFSLQNATTGLTVFLTEQETLYLNVFLQSAEMYFMVGHRVNYYIFTDKPEYVPYLNTQKGRQIIILEVESYYDHWQDISMQRMEMISNFSQQHFHQEVDYLVCADVHMRFSDHVGVEILSSLFGTLHLRYYRLNRTDFPMNVGLSHKPIFLKMRGTFIMQGPYSGSVPEVYKLTKACHEAMMVDQANHIQAIWHDESHLNKYLLYHKPSKVLSPEYMCNNTLKKIWDHQGVDFSSNIKRIRLVTTE